MSTNLFPRVARKRLAAIAAFAAVAFLPSTPAFAAQVTLSGTTTNSCTYSTVNVNGTGDLTVTCTGGTAPGTLAFNPSSYNVNTGATTAVSVARTGGTAGAVSALVSVTSGGCSMGNNTASFAAGEGGTKTVDVIGGTAAGSCTLGATATGTTFSGTASVSVNDPNAPGAFSFQLASSNAQVGTTNHAVRVVRTGGSFGAYEVAYTATPSAGLTGYSATVSPLQFATGESFKDIIVNAGTTVGTVAFALTGTTPPTTTAAGAHVVTVSSPSNCPTPGNNVNMSASLPPTQTGITTMSGPVGSIIAVPLHANTFRIRVFNSSQTPAEFKTTYAIAQCPGDMQATWPQSGNVPCRKSATYTGSMMDIAAAPILGKCHWTAAQRAAGNYYMNIRIETCNSGNCSFNYQVEY